MGELKVITSEPEGSDVLARIEEVLEEAKAGQLSSIAIAVVYRDGSVNASWSFAPSMPLLIGSVGRLQHRLNQRLDGE